MAPRLADVSSRSRWDLPELLRDWEAFVNADGTSLPAFLQAALMHYQFETIHPFLDGNGRIGRLLINLLLMSRDRLPLPLLYLSHYFETHRDDYCARLQAVREEGDIAGWLVSFLRAVQHQAHDAVARSRRLIEIPEESDEIPQPAEMTLRGRECPPSAQG